MTEYTPTTEEVREIYAVIEGEDEYGHPYQTAAQKDEGVAEFDRWLAARDAEVAARTLEEAITGLLSEGWFSPSIEALLKAVKGDTE